MKPPLDVCLSRTNHTGQQPVFSVTPEWVRRNVLKRMSVQGICPGKSSSGENFSETVVPFTCCVPFCFSEKEAYKEGRRVASSLAVMACSMVRTFIGLDPLYIRSFELTSEQWGNHAFSWNVLKNPFRTRFVIPSVMAAMAPKVRTLTFTLRVCQPIKYSRLKPLHDSDTKRCRWCGEVLPVTKTSFVNPWMDTIPSLDDNTEWQGHVCGQKVSWLPS